MHSPRLVVRAHHSAALRLVLAVAVVVMVSCAGAVLAEHSSRATLQSDDATSTASPNPAATTSPYPADSSQATSNDATGVALQGTAAAPVRPLRARITPDVLVLSRTPLTAALLQRIGTLAHATHLELLDVGTVHVGAGTTLAIGVDPSTFRAYTPASTAESDPLWNSIAGGNVAVAQAEAAALGVALGANTRLGAHESVTMRVGAYATTGLPGVGVVVDSADDRALGLTRAGGLLVTAPGQDPGVTAVELGQALGSAVTATLLQVPLTDGRLQWVAPAFGPITSPFGWRQNPNDPSQREFHEGIDIGADLGAPIYAASAGVVEYAGPATGFGEEVILTNGDGVTTIYGHMEKILVTSGPVREGEPIALVGAEGDATGPHLHFGVMVNDQYVDPLIWLRAHGVTVDS